MGELACLPSLPLPPTTWSLLRACVSLRANGDGNGLDAVIIHHNTLIQVGRRLAQSLDKSWRNCERFLAQSTHLFLCDGLVHYYNIDVVACLLKALDVDVTPDLWAEIKAFLRRHACGRTEVVRASSAQRDISEQMSDVSRSRSPCSSARGSSALNPSSHFGCSVSVGASDDGHCQSSNRSAQSSSASCADMLALRSLVAKLQVQNMQLRSTLDNKDVKVNQLQKDKRLLQQQVRRLKAGNNKLQLQLADAENTDESMFSLARVKKKNVKKWSWLTPLGRINVAVACFQGSLLFTVPRATKLLRSRTNTILCNREVGRGGFHNCSTYQWMSLFRGKVVYLLIDSLTNKDIS